MVYERFARTLSLLVWTFLVLYAVFFLYHVAASLLFPYPLDPGEGAILGVAYRLAQGHALYGDVALPPYFSVNYPPVYYLLSAIGYLALGPSLLPGRLISVLAAGVAGAVVFAATRDASGRGRIAAMAALTFFALAPVYEWAALAKVDALALGLALAGVYFLSRPRPLSYLSALLILLALFTKQTAASAVLAALVYLAVGVLRQPGTYLPVARRFAPPLVLLAVAFFLAVNQTTQGQFYEHLLVLNAQAISLPQLTAALLLLLRRHFVLLLAAVIVAVLSLRRNLDLWSIYFLVAVAVLVGTAGKVGAYTNYFLEVLALACILSGRAASRWAAKPGRWRLAVLGLALVQLVLLAHVPHYAEVARTPQLQDWQVGQRLLQRVTAAREPVLAENAGWLVLAGLSPPIDDLFFFSQLAREARWDQAPFVARLRQQEFGLVITEFDVGDLANAEYHLLRFTPEMLSALAASYRLDERVGDFYLLVPRTRNAAERSLPQ